MSPLSTNSEAFWSSLEEMRCMIRWDEILMKRLHFVQCKERDNCTLKINDDRNPQGRKLSSHTLLGAYYTQIASLSM